MEYNRVVLFGAGASFGSLAILPVPPPLGADLYGILANAFPDSWGEVSGEFQEKFRSHFETGMAALWDLYPAALSQLIPGAPSPHRLMQDMARLFISYQLAPGENDLYTRFLIALWKASKGEGTCLSTLNYEHLAEFAMAKVGLRQHILRPHGGCQFWLKYGGRFFGSGRAVGRGAHLISSKIVPLPRHAIQQRLNMPDQALYPCMAMYLKGKPTQMGQHYLWRIQHRFAERVRSSRSVALVGVRPWPSDVHIWRPIFHTDALILYVGSESDFDRLLEFRGKERRSVYIGSRFDSCIGDLVQAM